MGFKRSGSLLVKVLQTSKNLLRKMGGTAAVERARARSLEASASSCPPAGKLPGLCVLTWEVGTRGGGGGGWEALGT